MEASRILLDSLVETFVPEGDPLVVGVDETLERRQGKKIAAKGVYRDPHQMGRARLKGERLPNLSAVAEDPKTAWMLISVSDWYSGAQRTVEIVSETAVWYSTGLPAVPMRWVLIRDPKGEFETQALLCTDLDADPERIISWFVKRLSDGGYIPGDPPAPRVRNPAALVEAGDPEDRPGVAGTLLGDHATRSPIHGQG